MSDKEEEEVKSPTVTNIQQIIMMARRDNEGQSVQAKPPVWLVSFTDVIALMLTFFVLLYAMSDPEPEKWDKKIGITTQNKAQFSGVQNQAGSDEGVNLNRLSYAEAENLDYLQALFAEIEVDESGNRAMSIVRKDGYLLLSFDGSQIGGVNYNKKFINFLNRLTPLLKSLDNQLTLLTRPDERNGFVMMQKLGENLRDNGYKRQFVIQQADDILSSDYRFAISIQPDNGRRITR